MLTIRGTPYPVLLPKVSDPRLHLAAVIITLQVLGQTAFGFNLSIAQILVAIGTCALLEVGIAFFRQHVVMWPASALLTGNGVAFILRVPGTPHGDWWSLHGAWIFAATAAVSLLSKHLIRWRGRHIFNPSNFGLVLCFLVLGENRAEPLDFWWGPMSLWLALAIALIVVGGLTILSRLRLLVVAGGFWLAFAAGIGVLAASGHSMTARWHLGPITGSSFWWLLVTSPEILIFLFFMITDPMTIPKGRVARVVYSVCVGLLATLLIAPQTTEFATKVAVLSALALVCAARPLLERLLPAPGSPEDRALAWGRGLMRHGWVSTGALALAAAGFAGLVVVAGIPARPDAATARALPGGEPMPQVTVLSTNGISGRVDPATVDQIARDIVLDLGANADALRLRDPQRATAGAGGAWLVDLRQQIGAAAGRPISVSSYRVSRVGLTLTRGAGQAPPRILASIKGVEQVTVYRGRPPKLELRHDSAPFEQSLEVALQQGHYVIVGVGGATAPTTAPPAVQAAVVRATGPLADVRLQDVASQVGLDFRQGAFRFGVSNDLAAQMGGGVCWLDYDQDGWLDLFVVNSFSDSDRGRWEQHGGLPRSALFHNVRGSFVNVSKQSRADLPVRGEGCVAADFNGDGYTDLLITTASYDKLLWNDGDGTFTEGAKAAGIDSFGWHSGAAVADVNGDGRPDLFVAGYTDLNTPVTNAIGGFPSNYQGVRDLLYLNEGNDKHGHSRFREVGVQAGLEATRFRHGLGALFTDYNGDGRADLYVANDEDPNQLYENVPWPGGAAADPEGLGFRFEERGTAEGVADPYAGMGIASGDYNGDGRLDLFVTNSRREPYALLRHGTSCRSAHLPRCARRFAVRVRRFRRLGCILGRPRAQRQARPRSRQRGHPDHESCQRRRPHPGPVRPSGQSGVEAVRERRSCRAPRDPARERPGAGSSRLRQQRNCRHRSRLGRRSTRAPPKHGRRRALARGQVGDVLTRSSGDGRAARRSQAREGDACGKQLPVLRGSTFPLRLGRRRKGEDDRHPLPGWRREAALRRASRPGRRRQATPGARGHQRCAAAARLREVELLDGDQTWSLCRAYLG